MGRVDPSQIAAGDVPGGESSNIDVVFDGFMGPGDQNPVTYAGDVDALMPNPPNMCPTPPTNQSVQETTFQVATQKVSVPRTVKVRVHGPNVVKEAIFTVSP